jgi:hypothetical protein
MDPVQEPTPLTAADVPELRSRVRVVWSADNRYRTGVEKVITWLGALAWTVAVSLLWSTSASWGRHLVEVTATGLVLGAAVTYALVRARFGRSER